jgi:peptide subunit release factor 1 (eRF1)
MSDLKQIPPTGMALFCDDSRLEVIIPPLPIPRNLYRCDKKFHTEYITDLFKQQEIVSYVYIPTSSSEKVKGFIVEGTNIQTKFQLVVDLPTGTRRGGQSSKRLERIMDEKRALLLEKILESIKKSLFSEKIIIGGYGGLYKDVAKEIGTQYVIKCKSIDELIKGGNELSNDNDIKEEKEIVGKISKYIDLEPDRCLFGIKEVSNALLEGRVKTVYASFSIDCDVEIVILKYTGFLKNYGDIMAITWY